MDKRTNDHLLRWAEQTLSTVEYASVLAMIYATVRRHPDLLADRTWPEIRSIAERTANSH